MKKLTFYSALCALIFTALACNTANGFGKDMEKAGEKIQKETK